MLKTVETNVAHIETAGKVGFEQETLVLEGLGHHEVGAETLYSAISPGTELAAFEGLQPLRPDRRHSRVVGYCNLARVLGTGEWVRKYRAGDFILTLESHRSHFVCGEDEILLCLPERGYTPEQLEEVSTTYLFHQGYSSLLAGDLKPGQYVGVVGLGTLGLATIAVADRFGARVLGFSNRAGARAVGAQFGATAVLDKRCDEPVREALRDTTASTGIDIVVVTGSGWDDWHLALELVRPGGKICVLGFPGRRDPVPPFNPLDPQWFYRKQISVLACGYTPDVDIDPRDIRFTIRRNCAYLVELILNGELPARRLISQVAPWNELAALYRRIAAREEGFLTAVLLWSQEASDG